MLARSRLLLFLSRRTLARIHWPGPKLPRLGEDKKGTPWLTWRLAEVFLAGFGSWAL